MTETATGTEMSGADEQTLGTLLERAADSARGVRILDRDERPEFLTYADLRDRARDTGQALRALGVEPGDRVALVLPTGFTFYDAFFGCIMVGAVPVPLYPPVRIGRLAEYHKQTATQLTGCRVRLVLSDERTSRVLGRPVAAAGPALGLKIVDVLRRHGRERCRGAGKSGTAQAYHADSGHVALIQHSSGTTGTPRPVRLTHGAVLANLQAIRTRILRTHPETAEFRHAAVSWLPLYHDMGLIGCLLTALAHPADLTLIPPEAFVADPAIWLRAMSRYGGTVSGSPNFAYSYCAERINAEDIEGVDLSHWLVALTGAEPVIPGALLRFARRFEGYGFRLEALTPVYGLAEATLAVTFSDPAEPFRAERFERSTLAGEGVARSVTLTRDADAQPRAETIELVSVGPPVEGAGVRIMGKDEAEVADGVLGRVQVGGLSMFDGYDDEREYGELADDPSPKPVLGPWFDTGDTGFLRNGELFLYGRTKDVIILRGRKYAPQEIETALDGLPGLRRGCVAAISVPRSEGEEEVLVLLAERGRDASPRDDGLRAAEVRRRVTEMTGLVPSRVAILRPGTLPRTSSGKIRRAEARRRYCNGDLTPPNRVGALSLAVEMIRSRLALARMNGTKPEEP